MPSIADTFADFFGSNVDEEHRLTKEAAEEIEASDDWKQYQAKYEAWVASKEREGAYGEDEARKER